MIRLDRLSTKELIRLFIERDNENQRSLFYSYNPSGGRYTKEQKKFTIEKARSIGVRATARLLQLPRRTIQRWLRAEGTSVKLCPDWIYEWAYWRKKRQEKWKRMFNL
jgi:hypothetical protein